MPELPEVEVVRRGLARWVLGARLGAVEVLHPRPVRRHEGGPADFAARLTGTRVTDVVRRGKFLWMALDDGEALMAHLGMSGQLLVQPVGAPDETHLRIRLRLAHDHDEFREHGDLELRFVDQRMFGGLSLEKLVPATDCLPAGLGARPDAEADPLLPVPVLHIARDLLDPHLDEPALITRFRSRRTGVKRALLDQGLVSGVGNIYADEALWRVKLHYARPADGLTGPAAKRLLQAAREVMTEALAQGGTSFDDLYVNVNGESGYFDRSLAVYGQENEPCPRCGTPVRRDAFMNRSSYTCPRCQPRPRGVVL